MAKVIHDNNQREVVIMSPTEYNKLIEIKKEAEALCNGIDDLKIPEPKRLELPRIRLLAFIADHRRIVQLERLL
jgi:hypothetical protein